MMMSISGEKVHHIWGYTYVYWRKIAKIFNQFSLIIINMTHLSPKLTHLSPKFIHLGPNLTHSSPEFTQLSLRFTQLSPEFINLSPSRHI